MLNRTEIFDRSQTRQRVFFSTKCVYLFPGHSDGSLHVAAKFVGKVTAEDDDVVLVFLRLLVLTQFVDFVSSVNCGD